MSNHRRFTLSRRLKLEIVIVTLFRHQIFQILIDFTLDLPLLIVELFNLVIRQLAYFIDLVLAQPDDALQVAF